MHSHPTLAFSTLGCRTNQAETAQLAADLADVCAIVPFSQEADVYVVNTCTVTHEADRQSRQLVRRAHRANPEARIVVTGCAVDFHPDEFAEMPGVSLVARNAEKDAIARAIADWYQAREGDWRPATPAESGHTRAWLKVSEGCNNRCSFCIVPTVRGRERSIPPDTLVERARAYAALGYQELVLTGTHIGGYGKDLSTGLAALLGRLISEVPEIPRFRVASIEPIDFPDTLIERFASLEVCPSVHLCLQSGSSRILAAMRRRYNADQYRRLVSRIKEARPDAAFTTDVVVGFPGETEADFLETCRLVEEIGFAGVHLFPFSVREGTHAATLGDRVPPAVIAERMDRLAAVAGAARHRFQEGFIGREVEILTERTRSELRPGTTPHGLKVWVDAANTEPNQRWLVRVDRLEEEGPVATLLEPIAPR
ncbi:MAG TPA: tRNA (N(6)-L-threonylcarbamoyladenosine(37)-C(2))-methylthiotransferase MtaB [Pantanalinema sp.]